LADVKTLTNNAVGLPGFMSEDDCFTFALPTVSKVYGSENFASAMLAYLKARTIEPNYSRLSVGDSFYISEVFETQAPVGVYQLGVL
jgi:hypothetical protein